MIKLNKGNIKEITYVAFDDDDLGRQHELLDSLVNDIIMLNVMLKPMNVQIYIGYQDQHTDYSPERTDPCPDYYGMFYIGVEDYGTIGSEMTLDELDSSLMLLGEFIEKINLKTNERY